MPWRTVLGWFGLLIAAALVTVAGIYVVFWPISDLIARHDVGAITGAHRAAALQAARDAARGRLLTFGAGLFALGALVYTARNFTLARRNVQLTEQSQVTDRYTKGIEQLGSDKLDVRIGAVYALERIAHDSATDHPTIMEVLSAFVREHSREPWPPPAADKPGTDAPARSTRPDVQAAVTVIGRRDITRDQRRIDLTGAILTAADLTDAILIGANLRFANLSNAKLSNTDLSKANLNNTDLTGAMILTAHLNGTFLSNAKLTGTHFGGTYLNDAKLSDADLTDAVLMGVSLVGAYLASANLAGAELVDTDLTGADLTGAHWPPDEVVPEGWQRDDRRGRSGRLKRADTHSGGAATE